MTCPSSLFSILRFQDKEDTPEARALSKRTAENLSHGTEHSETNRRLRSTNNKETVTSFGKFDNLNIDRCLERTLLYGWIPVPYVVLVQGTGEMSSQTSECGRHFARQQVLELCVVLSL